MSVVFVSSWMVALAAAALLLVFLAFCSSYWPDTCCGVPGQSEAVDPSDASAVADFG
ncbi:MAG: hypothetical protein OEM22_03390 [Acidimicrobiia bacterium]|nr:hypothetical protein [Acidimicrobiia bacterium]